VKREDNVVEWPRRADVKVEAGDAAKAAAAGVRRSGGGLDRYCCWVSGEIAIENFF
jgi:hypothetical protein